MTESNVEEFSGWAILELLGHRRLGGLVKTTSLGGAPTFRIDIPGDDGESTSTQYYAASALYALTPVTEEVARLVAKRNRPEPVRYWEMPQLSRPSTEDSEVGDDDPLGVDRE
jgi:hypothetical protein